MKDLKEKSSTEIVHKWVVDTLKEKGWSARYWALEAGVGASTLQRFIKEKPWCLSASTIGLLGAKSGSYPFKDPLKESLHTTSIPVMGIEGGNMKKTNDTISTAAKVSADAFAVPVAWDTMDSAGRGSIYPGDVIVVDPKKKPKEGQVVMIKNVDEFSIYEYQPPYLLARSTKKTPNVDLALVDVLGVVCQVIRNME
mgnify:CR=1 FL=1